MEQWEYLYLSRRQWRDRVAAKVGYRWKPLLTPGARQRFHEDHEREIESVLNDLGRQGWELAGLLPVALTVFGGGGSLWSDAIVKRRVGQHGFGADRAEGATQEGIKVL